MASSELVNNLLLLGAAQGLFLAALLFAKRTNSVPNKILAVAMIASSIFIFEGVFYTRQYYYDYPHFIGISEPLIFVFGPILYLYARAVSEGIRAFPRKWLLHFIPALLVPVVLSSIYLLDGPSKIAFLEGVLRGDIPTSLFIVENLKYPHGIVYLILTIQVLKRHRARLKATRSTIDHLNLIWLRNMTIGLAIVWGMAILHFFLKEMGLLNDSLDFGLIPLVVSGFIYAIGYLGLRQPEIFSSRPADTLLIEEATTALPTPAPELNRYEKSGLSQEKAEGYLHELLRVMQEEKPYIRNDLTLQELAERLSISAHNLSEVINTRLEKNFYDFVNSYRVEEVKQRLQNSDDAHLTILAIALESGFNAKSSFNTAFKKHTQMTPSQYKKRLTLDAET